jgi:Secretion system C-terminal sorting domain
MKKIIVIFSIVLIFYQSGISCDCLGSGKTFCDEANSINENEIIARIQIESREGLGGQARILNLYKGSEERKVIQIWGGNGANCINTLGKVGQIFIMKIGRITKEYPFSPEKKIGDYSSGFICANTTLWVDKGKIRGVISQTMKYELIEDIDPMNLFFCPLFKSDAQELQTIQISPNPTSNDLTIKGLKSDITVLIFDAIGRLLAEKAVAESNNSVLVGDLTSGLYIIRFRKNMTTKSLKFVKL